MVFNKNEVLKISTLQKWIKLYLMEQGNIKENNVNPYSFINQFHYINAKH